MIVAIDPGRNVGVAFVADDGRLLARRILEPAALANLEVPEGARLLVGDGTGSEAVVALLERRGLAPEMVPEAGTSLEARALYFQANEPRGLARLVPVGLRVPPGLIDDYAAYAIALRWLRERAG